MAYRLHDIPCSYCDNQRTYCKGLCKSCYNYLGSFGTLERKPRRDPLEQFWAQVDKNGKQGCWTWLGPKSRKGYGQFSPGSRGRLDLSTTTPIAHRIAWELTRGPIPEGLHLDHLCLNKACVNPEHLEPVTNQENMQRAKGHRTHCRRGHPHAGFNLVLSATGRRTCRTCRDAAKARFHERNPHYYSKGRSVVLKDQKKQFQPGRRFSRARLSAKKLLEAGRSGS